MGTEVKLLMSVTNCTRIRNCIEDYVASEFPFDLEIGWAMGKINYRYPDKPDDATTRFISFNAKSGGDRLKLKTARYLTRKCGLNEHLNDGQIRFLAEKINLLLWTEEELNSVKLLRGPAITEAYNDEIGGNSCMTGCNSSYTRLYEVNPTRFEMLVIRSDNDSARGIVHHLDDGRILLGKVYTTAEHLLETIDNYAEQQGWLNMATLDSIDKDTLIMSGLKFCKSEIPYMDVLTQGEVCDNLLTVSYNTGLFNLQNQNGSLSDYICETCGGYIYEDDIYSGNYGDSYCQSCFEDNFIICDCCNDIICSGDSIFIEGKGISTCQNCADSHYYSCKTCGEYHEVGNMRFFNDTAYCEDCYDDVANSCVKCGEEFAFEDLSSISGSEPMCPDCAIEIQEAEGIIL